jgi:hypothetical protein
MVVVESAWNGEQPATLDGVGGKVGTVADIGDVNSSAFPQPGFLRTLVYQWRRRVLPALYPFLLSIRG